MCAFFKRVWAIPSVRRDTPSVLALVDYSTSVRGFRLACSTILWQNKESEKATHDLSSDQQNGKKRKAIETGKGMKFSIHEGCGILDTVRAGDGEAMW